MEPFNPPPKKKHDTDTEKRTLGFHPIFFWANFIATENCGVVNSNAGGLVKEFHPKNNAITLPKTNIAPKNGGFQYQSPFPVVYFQGLS